MGYQAGVKAGVAGGLVDTGNKDLISRTVEADDGIKFGLAVAQGENDKGIRMVKTGDTDFVGITVHDRSSKGEGGFVKFESARVLDEGVIWVEVTEPVNAGDKAAVDLATGKFNKAGAALTGARFETSADTGSLAQLRLK